MNKSGLSSVVATVLLLLLTVAAMATLSGIVIPFVKERLYGSTDCSQYEDAFTFVEEIDGINYNCYDFDADHGLIIKSKPSINESDENLKGFQISFQREGTSRSFELNKSGASSVEVWNLDGAYYYPAAGEIVSYGFELDNNYTKAEVRAVLVNGKICKASDSIEISRCLGGFNFVRTP